MDRGGDEQGKQSGGHGGDDATEWKKVAELRAIVEAQDPAAKRLRKPEGMDRDGKEQAKQNGDVVCDGGGDASEWKKVRELRAAVEVQDPAAKGEDGRTDGRVVDPPVSR